MKAQRKMLFSGFYVQFTMPSKVQNIAIAYYSAFVYVKRKIIYTAWAVGTDAVTKQPNSFRFLVPV